MLVFLLQCAHPGNVKKGFFTGGVIDLKSEPWPDFYAIVNICKKRNADKHLCLDEFAMLYHHMEEHGHVPDEVFERHAFSVDLDENGKPVRCPAGISQEHLQRAKSLSHDDQKKLRRERKEETMRKRQNKLVEEKLSILHILEDNRLCEEILLDLIVGPETSGLAQAELEQFSNKRCKSLWS
jgi:hypothetical protein